MSEVKENSQNAITGSDLPLFVSSIAQAINETYTYNSSASLFCSLVPNYIRDYMYRYVRPACQWLDGYVPYIHDGQSGIPSTKIGGDLITGLTKQVVGEKLVFKLADEVDQKEDTLNFITKWAEKQKAIRSVYAWVGFGLGVGTSLIKMNVAYKDTPELWWEAVRLDQSYYLADNENDVKDATFFIRSYTDTRQRTGENQAQAQFILCEHRFYKVYDKPLMNSQGELLHKKGDRVPMVEYNMYRTNGQSLQGLMPIYQSSKVDWEQLPRDIKDMVKQDYAIIRIGEPQNLPFKDLGIKVFQNDNMDLSVPTARGFGKSMLLSVQNDLFTYEYACACQLRDMYLGKGTVYLPKNLSMGDFQNKPDKIAVGGVLSKFDNNDAMQLMRGVDPEQQKAIVEQFDVREGTWQTIKENCLKDIAVKWGMSAKILASYLAQTAGQQTATQVDSEDDMSIAFINLERSYVLPLLNDLIEDTLNFYGKVNNVSVNFASPSLINKDRLLDRITKMLDSGLIDIEEAIRTYYPDASEDELKRKIDIANKEREKALQQQQADLNPFGDDDMFGDNNNYNDLGGDNLNGSTTTENKPN